MEENLRYAMEGMKEFGEVDYEGQVSELNGEAPQKEEGLPVEESLE